MVFQRSYLIEALLKAERLDVATTYVLDLLKKGLHPFGRIFKFYINSLAKTGNVDAIKSLEPHLTKVI